MSDKQEIEESDKKCDRAYKYHKQEIESDSKPNATNDPGTPGVSTECQANGRLLNYFHSLLYNMKAIA
ncbi:MAG: hypothetical protein GDA56_17750 [Hormoscilla sp. GM7CHS1pb]|nr:hypothetical protein [Hormoscilla sp. GM7CHS1pb]